MDTGPARYMDPAFIYTTNQVLASVSTNNVTVHYVSSSILGIDKTDDPYVTNMQYIAATSNATVIVSNYVPRVMLNMDITDMETKTYAAATYTPLTTYAAGAIKTSGVTTMLEDPAATISNLSEIVFMRRTGNTNNLAVTGPGTFKAHAGLGTYTNSTVAYNSYTAWANDTTNLIFYSTNELRYVWWEHQVDTNVVGWATNSVSATSPIGIYKGITGVLTSAWETFVYHHTDVNQTNVVTYDRLNAAFLSVNVTNIFPGGTTNVWGYENGLLKSHSTL